MGTCIMKLGLSLVIGLAALTAAAPPKEALTKTFQKCELASELLAYGGVFTSANIGDWICLTYYESSWKTSAKGGPNYNGSYDYGIFQINDYYWCYADSPSSAQKYNDCSINCWTIAFRTMKSAPLRFITGMGLTLGTVGLTIV